MIYMKTNVVYEVSKLIDERKRLEKTIKSHESFLAKAKNFFWLDEETLEMVDSAQGELVKARKRLNQINDIFDYLEGLI